MQQTAHRGMPFFGSKYGSRHRYSALRRLEALLAMKVAGVRDVEFLADMSTPEEFVDQELYRHLEKAMVKLGSLIERHNPRSLVSLAYEGGHPDHDTCCFLATMLSRRYSLPVWEIPLYHRDPEGRYVRQEFPFPTGGENLITGTPKELSVKRIMIATHKSQAHALSDSTWNIETVRPMFSYDFSSRPHPGLLNYEAWGWKPDAERLIRAYQKYMKRRKTITTVSPVSLKKRQPRLHNVEE